MWNQDVKVTDKGFINKDHILKYVSQELIYGLVFGFEPKEYDYIVSPFREDKTPGCYFEYDPSGILRFVDYANPEVKRGIKMNNIDCFNAVMIHFNLPNFYETLKFIKKKLMDGKNLTEIKKERPEQSSNSIKPEVIINTVARNFLLLDKHFWQDRYEITKQNLIEDNTFPISLFSLTNEKKGKVVIEPTTATYCFNLGEGKKKIYRPYHKGKSRFFTNCTGDDVGAINSLPKNGDKLIITKSYKDYRVIKNQGYNVVWFQNEGMFPSLEILLPLCNRFKEVIVIFDNDETGIIAAQKLVAIINSYIPDKAKYFHIPIQMLKDKIKDPADFIEAKGRNHLLEFLFQRV